MGSIPGLLDWEDPLEEGIATHSSILAWRIPWTEEPGGLRSILSQRVGHDWSDLIHTHRYLHTFHRLILIIWFHFLYSSILSVQLLPNRSHIFLVSVVPSVEFGTQQALNIWLWNCMNFFHEKCSILCNKRRTAKRVTQPVLATLVSFPSFFFKWILIKQDWYLLKVLVKQRRFSRRWLHPFIKSICVTATGRNPNNLKWLALGNRSERTRPSSEMEQHVKSHFILIWWPRGKIFLSRQIL